MWSNLDLFELPDDDANQIGRHPRSRTKIILEPLVRSERNKENSSFISCWQQNKLTNSWTVLVKGMLLREMWLACLIIEMLKVDFMSISSKHGKAVRAPTGWKCVDATYLCVRKFYVKVNKFDFIHKLPERNNIAIVNMAECSFNKLNRVIKFQ